MSMIPQSVGLPPQPAASNGIDLPPAEGVDLPPSSSVQGVDLPLAPEAQAAKDSFISQRWYDVAGKALSQHPNGADQAVSFLYPHSSPQVAAFEKQNLGNGSLISPEEWGRVARSTVTPEVQKTYDEKFSQDFALQQMLKSRHDLALSSYKAGLGDTKDLSRAEDFEKRGNATVKANEALKAQGFPELTNEEFKSLRDEGYKPSSSLGWFFDTTGDVASTLMRATSSTVASPGESLLAVGSKVSDLVSPRGPGESNWFSRRLAESESFQKNFSENYTPGLSDRKDMVNWSLRTIAESVPALAEMLATEGSSGPRILARLAAMTEGGTQSAEALRKDLVQIAKDRGMNDSDAESLGLQGAAVVGPIATLINYLPLHQIIDKNPEIRPILFRIAASAAVNGAAGTAQNIAEQLTKLGLVNKDFSIEDLQKALESSLVVGGAQGLIPTGPRGLKTERTTEPSPPAAPKGVEFSPGFLGEQSAAATPAKPPTENLLPGGERRLAENPEFMKSLEDQQKAIAESDAILKNQIQAPQLPGEHPLIAKAKNLGHMLELGQIPEADRADLEAIHQNTGVDMIPIKSETMAGFADLEHPNTVLYDVHHPDKSVLGAVSHEVTHIFEYNNPKVAEDIVKAMPDTYAKRLWDNYARQWEKAGATPEQIQAYKDRAYHTEILAEAVRDSVSGNGILLRTLKGKASWFETFKDAIGRVLNKFTAKGRFINKLDEVLRSHFELNKGIIPESFEGRGTRIARAYEALQHEPNKPEVKQAYAAFKQETLQQFHELEKQGVKMEPWTQEGQPYKNSRDMMADVNANKHLWVFTGGEIPADHPLAEKVPGSSLSYNDVFRAVHDYYGHAIPKNQFGPKGEEAAYQAHSKMYSDQARPAMATEARGQNSFVNFGPNGEHNRTKPAETIYAPQKAGLLPTEFHAKTENALPGKQYYQIGHKTEAGPKAEELWYQDERGNVVTAKGYAHTAKMIGNGLRGRIDHATHEISMVDSYDTGSLLEQRAVIRQLEKKFPDYTIHYGGELISTGGSHFLPGEKKETDTLPSLSNIRYDAKSPTISERVKGIINAAKDSPVTFKMTWLDKIKRAVQNDFWAVNKATTAAKLRNGGGEILPSSDPDVLFSVLRGGGESHAEQRDTGMRDAKNQVLLDPKTKEPITTQWKLQPIIDAATAHFGEATGNRVDRMQRAVVDTLISQSTVERGENRVRNEEYKTMQEKIKQIIRSLPGGESLVKKLEDDSGGQPSVEYDPRLADTIKQVKDEHKRTLRMITDAKQRLADLREMNKAADQGPQPSGEAPKRSNIPTASAVENAQARLDALHAMIESEQTGQPLKLNDILTEKDLATIRQTALERPLSGIAGEKATGHLDIAKAQTILEQMKQSAGWPGIEEATRRYRLWGDMVLQKLTDQGFISPDSARKMRVSNQFYANMQRVMDESGLGDVYEGSAKLHKFRGSNRLIDNPYVNQDVTSDRILKASQENQARRAFVDLAGKYPDLAQKSEKSGPDTITIVRDGKPEFWKVDPELKDAFESFSTYHPEFLGGLLNTFGRMKRWGVTKVPSFILRNFTRDFQDRLFKGSSGVKDILHALDRELISEMTAVGGSVQKTRAGSARLDYHKELSKRLKEMASDVSTITALPSKAWAGYSHLNDVSENANRVAEYNAAKAEAKRRGWNDYDATLYAASKSRGLIDFAQAGSLVRQINRVAYMAFLNGRLQGSFGDFAAIRKTPGKVAMKALIMGAAPALAAYAVAAAQGKEEEYKALPIWRRTMFTNFYVGMGPVKWISIPKVPLAALFAAPVEFEIERSAGRKDALQKMALQGLNVFSPVDDPSVIPASFLLEGLTNYSFYYNRSIIPDWERSLPVERRNTEGSSNLGKMLSQITKAAGFQIDPRFIDNAISRQFGGTGQIAESVSNLGSGKPMDTIGAFLSRASGFTAETPGASSPDIANVYSRASEFFDEGSPEIKQIAAYLKKGYEATDRAGQDAAFAQARDVARLVRKDYDTNGDRLKQIGKLNSDINAVQAEYKTLRSFEDRLKWSKENPDQVKLLKLGESFDRIETRVNELRKLRLNPGISDQTRKMADREIERLYSALMKMSGLSDNP